MTGQIETPAASGSGHSMSSAKFQSKSEPNLTPFVKDFIGLTERAALRAKKHASALGSCDSKIGLFRLALAVGLLSLLVSVIPELPPVLDALLILISVGVFVFVSMVHKRIQARSVFWKSVSLSYENETSRTRRDFKILTESATPWGKAQMLEAAPPGHLYAVDLDVKTLLLPFLDTCVTPEGSQALVKLVLFSQNVTGQERVQRSVRIKDLSKQSKLLRELDATRFSEDVRAEYEQGKVCSYTELAERLKKEAHSNRVFPYVGFAAVSFVAWGLLLVPAHIVFLESGDAEPFLGRLLRYAIIPLIGLGVYRSLIDTGLIVKRRLMSLRILMREIETVAKIPSLNELAQTVRGARKDLSRLETALDLIQARTNPVFWLFMHALLPFDSVLCLWSWVLIRRLSAIFEKLSAGLTEFDLDSALARYAAENPEFVFSESVLSDKLIDADQMGHPLIGRSQRTCNSVSWSTSDGLILLTGSNMSGKSTFLRTLGINCILHNIGAPVCARAFRAPSISLLCAIRVDDSIEQGISYFYAEVKRLALLLKELERVSETQDENEPAENTEKENLQLYLVDEIFRGTNNRERFLGSLYVIKSLVSQKGIGIVTTHDLSLTSLPQHAKDSSRSMRNMHFKESVENGLLCFDYVLREGPCPTTNALRIMHAEGLPVPAHITEEQEQTLRESLSI